MDLRLDIPWVSTSVKPLSFRCLADTGYFSAAHHSVASSLPGCTVPDDSSSRIPSVVRRGMTCRSGVGQGRVLGVADMVTNRNRQDFSSPPQLKFAANLVGVDEGLHPSIGIIDMVLASVRVGE